MIAADPMHPMQRAREHAAKRPFAQHHDRGTDRGSADLPHS